MVISSDFAGRSVFAPIAIDRQQAFVNLRLLNVLGSGAYGSVYRAADTSSAPDASAFYAVKCLARPADDTRTRFCARIASEALLHERVSAHPNIVTFHALVEENAVAHLVVDFCAGGDLFTAIAVDHLFWRKDALVKSLFLQLVDAVQHCHDLGVAHRDLKPDNILLCRARKTVFLADFGLATRDAISQSFGVGTDAYSSPECLGAGSGLTGYHTTTNDIWSLSVILLNMVSGTQPWRRASPRDMDYRSFRASPRRRLLLLFPISAPLNDLLTALFNKTPAKRPSLRELRTRVEAIDTFFMSPAELAAAPKFVRLVADSYARVPVPAAATRAAVAEASDSRTTRTVGDGPPCPPLSRSPTPRGSGSTSADSAGPITPETHPVDPAVDVPDLPADELLGASAIVPLPVAAQAKPLRKAAPRLRRVGRTLRDIRSALRPLRV